MKIKKQKKGNHLHAIVLIAILMVAVCACQSEYYYYTRYYKVEKVFMTRIQIDDFPAKDVELYLTESAFSDCPPETIEHDGKCHAIMPYMGGSIDKAESVMLTSNGKEVNPVPLRYKDFIDTLTLFMNIGFDSIKEYRKGVCYNPNYTLPRSITGSASNKYVCRQDTSLGAFCYLLCFDKRTPLPESGIVKFKDREIKIEIDNNVTKCHLIGLMWQPSYFKKLKL